MIKHNLIIVSSGHQPHAELSDYQFLQIFYKLESIEIDDATNIPVQIASSGVRVVDLDEWVPDAKIPGSEVRLENLKQWVLEKIDLDAIQQENMANFRPAVRINT